MDAPRKVAGFDRLLHPVDEEEFFAEILERRPLRIRRDDPGFYASILTMDEIDALLPQTQCGRCTFAGCRPYATALANGDADINQCPPGGAAGIRQLAQLLGREQKELNPANGSEKPRTAALIDESRCIGCMLCIHACPVDAIVGGSRQLHTVLTKS